MKINSPAITYESLLVKNKTVYILSLQRMLGIPQSGRLDRQTIQKIMDFKAEHGIRSSKLVDFQTFEAIKGVYKGFQNAQADYEYTPHEYSDGFRTVAEMLSTAIGYYSLPLRRPKGGVYGYDAMRAVCRLREIYQLSAGKVIDGEFMHCLICDIRSINAMKKENVDR